MVRWGIIFLAANILWLASANARTGQSAVGGSWPGFPVIMWQTKLPVQYKALRQIGVTAARVQADRDGETPQNAKQNAFSVIAAGLRPYVENAATDFYSAYHRWFPDRPVNAEFLAVQQAWAQMPDDRAALIRHPGLSDRLALKAVERRLTQTALSYARTRPLFINLGDEPGIADLSAAWDFDFSNSSLSGLRAWLKDHYGTLDALNREWGTRFAQWREVVPPTTTQAMARADENYAAWSDFKDWMNLSFARAVRAGTGAVHAGAPGTLAAIEGAQMPGWGGYDYSYLAKSVDVMEMYDSGGNVEIAQSFNPRLVLLMTSSWAQLDAPHLAWQEFLLGIRGMVLWDEDDAFVAPDGSLGGRGRAAATFFAAAHGPLGRLLMASQPHRDPIAVLYSPASFRVQWMLDHRALGGSWTKRGAQDENEDNAVRAAQRRTLERLALLGYRPRFVSDDDVAQGVLRKHRYKALILPQALALSRRAAAAMREFVKAGGNVLADGSAGYFDGHGRHLDRPLLEDLFAGGNARAVPLPPDDAQALAYMARLFKSAGVTPISRLENASGGPIPGVKQFVYVHGNTTLVALLVNSPSASEGDLDARRPVTLVLERPAYAYDVVSGENLGRLPRLTLEVASNSPAVIAFSEAPIGRAGCKALFLPKSCSAGKR